MPRKTKTQPQPQITVDDALRALRADYYTEIRAGSRDHRKGQGIALTARPLASFSPRR